ncbi:MAG: filamentous hemagglutinin N-terminal domain-containing protein, partial [Sedimentisphaerales bacterium]
MGNFRRISKKYYVRQFVTCMLVYIMLLGMPVQVALAYIGDGGGGIPVAGDATITAPGGTNNALIDMITERAVINWQDFDTDVGQLAEFIKSSGGNFAVLNRVIGGNQTSFLGDLKALNGDVFVINTRGIVFGPDSYIQARNFVASGIDMSNNDFMVPDGQFAFQRNSSGYANDELIGNITNNGIDTGHGIHADQVALIGRNVTNKGLISAPGGAVVMAAGEAVYLNQFGSNVSVEVS